MKKLIALTLMVACLACFSLGCKKETPPAKPVATQPATDTGNGGASTTTPEKPATP